LALSQALNHLLSDPALAARLGAAARERANSEFDEDIFRDRMTTIYRDAVRAREEAKWSAAKTPHQ
jgi:glycosyltransferase involved in cell wall biosynthesis